MRLVIPGCIKDAHTRPWVRIFFLAVLMALYLTAGQLESPLGTYMFFVKDVAPPCVDPLFDKLPKENVKYFCKADKYLRMKHTYITPIEGAGALMFQRLEGRQDELRIQAVQEYKYEFLREHPCVSADDLESLLEVVVRATNQGVPAVANVSGGPNWSFGQSLFFSSTVVTTIGYGHVTPLSKPGKLFCMLYALLGIPLTLVLLSALVERLLLPATALLRTLNASLGHLYRPFTIRLVHLAIIVAFLVIFFLITPAAIFAALEPGWDFLDSFYYCFISLTTIGLGDYIPGDSPGQEYRPLYKVATTFFLLAGLTFLMLTLTVFYDIPQLNLSTVFSSVKMDEDPEKMRLSGSGVMGPGYGIGGLVMRDDYNHHDQRRSVVHIRPHQDDSPSPEDTTPVHARDMRVPHVH